MKLLKKFLPVPLKGTFSTPCMAQKMGEILTILTLSSVLVLGFLGLFYWAGQTMEGEQRAVYETLCLGLSLIFLGMAIYDVRKVVYADLPNTLH